MLLKHLQLNKQIAVPASSAAALSTQGIMAHTWCEGSVAFGQLIFVALERVSSLWPLEISETSDYYVC